MNHTMDVAIWQVLTAVGAVLGAVVGTAVAPWLTSLVPDGGPPTPRWFLTRPSVAAVGALTGLLAGLHVRGTAEPPLWPSALVLLAAAAGACLVDAAGHRLPDVLVLRGWGLGAVLALAALPWVGVGRVLLALAVSVGCWAVLAAVTLAAPRALGYGDVKLLGLLALAVALLRPGAVVTAVVAAVVLGGLTALLLLATRRAAAGTHLAFGPWLLVGAAVAILAEGAEGVGTLSQALPIQ
jgi:leader peptidase (prepilin peptidase)/N-methyltransferase